MKEKNYSLEKNIMLMERAKQIIPGGAHTYSKGDDQFPINAPRMIERGKGCQLWDADGNQYLDFAMSLGTIVLGHAYDPVLDAVRSQLDKGVNFVRPSIIEGELAEMLVDIVPSAEMVKLAKHGSDATTAAVKLSRAYTGCDYVARCENDPFNAVHDWFIGSTVVTRGIPEDVRKFTLKFEYNNLESVRKLFDQYPNKIACILLEPVSMIKPKNNFLEELKILCEKNGAVLIFDEVVSGFKFALGGAQEMTKVTPHLTALGKAMANGFSVSALVGKKEIMELGGIDHSEGERVFLLSTTHGGETHSIAASIATINEIRDKNIIDHFWWVGKTLKEGILKAAEDVGAQNFIDVIGYPCKPGIIIKDGLGNVSMEARTLFLQETIARGLLIPYVVPSYAHKKENIDMAVDVIRDSLVVMKNAFENGGIANAVRGDIVKPVFRKYNHK